MGSEFWKQPAKRLDREFRSMGAARIQRTSAYVAYRFPDGARREVRTNIGPANARALLADIQAIYGGRARDPLGMTEKRHGAPDIDLTRLVASNHAQIRLTQMSHQAGLQMTEVLHALRIPNRVLWSEIHDSWLWVGERIAVAVSVDILGHATVRTILWTQQELWDANPRPEKARI